MLHHIFIYVLYMCIHVYVHVCVQIHMHVHVDVHVHGYVYACMHMYHGVLYYRPSQHACDFCISAWEAFGVLNILNMVIYY